MKLAISITVLVPCRILPRWNQPRYLLGRKDRDASVELEQSRPVTMIREFMRDGDRGDKRVVGSRRQAIKLKARTSAASNSSLSLAMV